MQELSDALRAATDDVAEPDLADRAWAEGRRRRVRGRVVAAATAGTVATLALASATVWRPALVGPDPVVDVARGTATTRAGATPSVWTDARLAAPASAPRGERWVVLVLERTDGPVPGGLTHLDGTSWRQVPGSTYPWTGRYQEVLFTRPGILLRGGCNAGSGLVTVSGDRLVATDLAYTLIGCGDVPAAAMDSRAADLLRSATAVLGDDGRLYLGGYVREENLPAGWRNDGRLAPRAVPLATTTWGSRGPQTARGPRNDG